MRFAVLHCRTCMQRVWVPENKLGRRGKCPECGEPMQTPGYVPADELVEGPPIMQDYFEPEPALAGGRV